MENVNDVEARATASFDELRQQLTQRTQEVREAVSAFVDERPLAAVGIAFGAGYLLSGALFSRLTARVVTAGGRLIIGNALRLMVAGLGPGMLLGALGLQEQPSGGGGRGQSRSYTPTPGTPSSSQH